MSHPKSEELCRFARGELDEVRFEEVAAHVEACEQCSSVLEETGAFPNLLDAGLANDLSGKALAAGSKEEDLPGNSRTASALALTGISEDAGSIVGHYKLLQRLGEGGMGVVYIAEQEKPVRRMVALKIIKPGMDSQQVIARFEAERQALAMMDHHNIAKVLDAGTTETGRPYFAMELVKGVPITEYCDKSKLTPRERLEMFIPVCQAIQHAHQKGIIHRDIKPSNVLVTLYDGKPVPKVIDFGIAKATQQKLTERTMFTGIGQILGTIEYMSPEQAEMNQLDIDTRSDVYSLGVMLYELLTGSTPITKDKLRGVGLEEMLRTIRETEPPKPSTRLSDSGEALPTISDVRKTEPTKLSKFVRGDLDWIVMKALEKDRTRRYETANGLATDVQRFLSDEAVEACPPSARYKLRKLARRNKAALVTGVVIAGILFASTIVSSSLAVWAVRAEKLASANAVKAQTALKAEEQQRKLAQANEAKATSEAIKSNEVAAFLKDMLKGVGPSVALGRDTTMLKEILDDTAERMSADLADQPEILAELHATVGSVYADLLQHQESEGQYRESLRLYRQLHGRSHAKVADMLHAIGRSLLDQAEYDRAAEPLKAALDVRRSLFGKGHAEVAASLHTLGKLDTARWRRNPVDNPIRFQSASRYLRDSISTYQESPGENSLSTALVLLDLADLLARSTDFVCHSTDFADDEGEKLRRLDEAESILNRVQSLVKSHESSEHRRIEAKAIGLLGRLQEARNKPSRALAMARKAVRIQESLPDGRIDLLYQLDQLIDRLNLQAKYSEAKNAYQRMMREANELYGPSTAGAAEYTERYASLLFFLGQLNDAVAIQRQVASNAAQQSDKAHASALRSLARYLTSNESRPSDEALDLLRQAWAIENADSGTALANALCLAGKIDEAVDVQNEVFLLANSDWYEASILNLAAGQQERNQALFEHALEVAQASDHPWIMHHAAKAILFDSDASADHVKRAVALAEESSELYRRNYAGTFSGWHDLCLAHSRYRQHRYADVDELLRTALEKGDFRTKSLGLTLSAMSHVQLGDEQSARERIDELGVFSVLPTELPSCFKLARRPNILAAMHLQTELRALIPNATLDSLSIADRVDLGVQRHSRHVQRHPDDLESAWLLARLLVWFHKKKEHHELCRRLMDRALESDNADEQFRAAWSFLIAPYNVIEMKDQAKTLANRAANSVDKELTMNTAGTFADYQLACALADIRLGNYEEAQVLLDETEPIVTLVHRGRWSALRAINHGHLGQRAHAKAALAGAKELIWPRAERGALSVELFSRKSWDNEVDSWLLLEEAESLGKVLR